MEHETMTDNDKFFKAIEFYVDCYVAIDNQNTIYLVYRNFIMSVYTSFIVVLYSYLCMFLLF